MPLMVVTNTIGAVDKIIVSNAALYGIIEDTHLVGQQYNWVREAFTDYKTYLLVLFVLSIHVPTGGVVAFGAQTVSGLGFSTLETMLLSIPTGATLTLSSFMVAVPQLWFKNKRCSAMGLCCIVPVVCCSLLQHLSSENKVG
ncbi:hypothetical protein NCS55_00826400 [Fusarium keratoplasticum]|nr:hypothetical protein NCS55_00826400 [Fusarium keratoplasticum]